MSYKFDLNRFFKAPIIKIDNKVRLPNLIQREHDECKKEINVLLDRLGNASAKAQHLHAAVTSSSKLAASDHFMYLIKDSEANGGYGLIIGYLKIGFKKLYVYDLKGEMHEREPLCVLDFYISESYQRQGYGKRLYDYMLKTENVEPAQLAIDRPSLKFSSFLKKHYDLSHSIPQANNFMIFEGFFSNQSEDNEDRTHQSAGLCRRMAQRPNSNRQTKIILTKMVEPQNADTSSDQQDFSSSPTISPADRVRPPDTTGQGDGNCFPNVNESQPNDPYQLTKQTNISVNPYNHPINPTIEKRKIASGLDLDTGQFTSTPLSSIYSRHVATTGWPQPNYAYLKRRQNNLSAKVFPSSVMNKETIANGNEMDTTRFYADKFCRDRDQERRRGQCKTANTQSSGIRLPTLDSSIYQRLPPQTKSKPLPWTLFNNAPTYTSLLHRGYSHTRLW